MAGEYKGFRSRRAYEDARVKDLGYKNYREYQSLRSDPLYKRWLYIASTEHGVPITTIRNASTPEGKQFNTRVANLISSGEWNPKTHSVRRRAPQVRRFFQYMGLVENDNFYRSLFAESPTVFKSAS